MINIALAKELSSEKKYEINSGSANKKYFFILSIYFSKKLLETQQQNKKSILRLPRYQKACYSFVSVAAS